MSSEPRCCRDWSTPIPQWSKGEYRRPNNKEDDLSIILRSFPFRDDEIDPTLEANRGQINGEGDTDTLTFTVEGEGMVELTIEPTEISHGSALDVAASILDSKGTEVATANPTKERGASFSEVLAAGEYQLVISGGYYEQSLRSPTPSCPGPLTMNEASCPSSRNLLFATPHSAQLV